MAISDNNPERRNLVVLSISIILYFLAGGSITDENIRLQVVNVTFSKPEVLVKFVWLLLFWFIYRYWLNHKGSWKEGFYSEAQCQLVNKHFYSYLVKKFDLGDDYSKSWYPDKHWVRLSTDPLTSSFSFSHTCKADVGASGQQKHESRKVDCFMDRVLVGAVTAVTFLREPSLSMYFMPYLFALIAIVLGVESSL
ncbi:TPA: hypothetical protein N2934_004382 [Vibrio parahaemolyticus]|nr:hypothetical protein [Vibrio parahaemolyticus]HCM1513431.1 hypothetical protein [Vibrio parahaemolyticus]